MKTARFWTVAILLISATMALVLGVVCLLYAIYKGENPHMQEEWPTLVNATLMFGILGAVAGTAFHGLRKQARWMWPAQAALAVITLGVGLILKNFLLG